MLLEDLREPQRTWGGSLGGFGTDRNVGEAAENHFQEEILLENLREPQRTLGAFGTEILGLPSLIYIREVRTPTATLVGEKKRFFWKKLLFGESHCYADAKPLPQTSLKSAK